MQLRRTTIECVPENASDPHGCRIRFSRVQMSNVVPDNPSGARQTFTHACTASLADYDELIKLRGHSRGSQLSKNADCEPERLDLTTRRVAKSECCQV